MNIKAPGTYVILLLAGICCFLLTVKNPRHPCSSTEDSFGDDITGLSYGALELGDKNDADNISG